MSIESRVKDFKNGAKSVIAAGLLAAPYASGQVTVPAVVNDNWASDISGNVIGLAVTPGYVMRLTDNSSIAKLSLVDGSATYPTYGLKPGAISIVPNNENPANDSSLVFAPTNSQQPGSIFYWANDDFVGTVHFTTPMPQTIGSSPVRSAGRTATGGFWYGTLDGEVYTAPTSNGTLTFKGDFDQDTLGMTSTAVGGLDYLLRGNGNKINAFNLNSLSATPDALIDLGLDTIYDGALASNIVTSSAVSGNNLYFAIVDPSNQLTITGNAQLQASIPEPSTYGLALAGAASAIALYRRRNDE